MKTILFVTSNPTKVLVAQSALDSKDIHLEQVKIDTPEIQSLDVKEVAAFSAKWAAKKLGKPVIVADSGLSIDALKGFPGSFVAYVDKTIGENGIMKLMEGKENRSAKYVLAAAYCEPNGEPIIESDELIGSIASKLKGSHGWFSDLFFIPEGHEKTMGCLPDEERKLLWPHNFWKRLAKKIK